MIALVLVAMAIGFACGIAWDHRVYSYLRERRRDDRAHETDNDQ